jgi:FkbM family methyltransferase
MSGIDINDHYKAIETTYGMMIINRHEYGLPWMLEEEGQWVPTEITFLMQFAKGNVLDIGANIGTHTLAFARTAAHVWSFEPQKLTHYTLCANLLLNNVMNVTPIQIALGNAEGLIPMWVPDPTVRNASAGIPVGEGNGEVALKKLDSLGIQDVYFIKIDVEGYEYEVLKGAEQTLKGVSFVYIEIHHGELIDPIVAFMKAMEFEGIPSVKTRIVTPLDEPDPGKPLFDVYGYLFVGKHVVIV